MLLETDPEDGADLAEPPGEITLVFNEEVELPTEAVRIFDSSGERVEEGPARHGAAADTVRTALAAETADAYTVSREVISADTHPVSGAFAFTVGDPDLSTAAAETGEPQSPAWDSAAAVVRGLVYLGTLLAVGFGVFLLLVHDREPREHRRLLLFAAGAAAVGGAATLALVPVQALMTHGYQLSAMADPALLRTALAPPLGVSVALRVLGLAVLVLGLTGPRRGWGGAAAALGALLTLGSFLFAGHTVTGEPRALVVAADLSHTFAAAVWFGGLTALAVVLAARARAGGSALEGAGMVARFSRMAVAAVLLVAVSGTALAWSEIREIPALFGSAYGAMVLGKVALVAVALVLGAYNNRWLVPAVRRGEGRAWRRLAAIVRWELALLLGVLAITAVLVHTHPPLRAEPDAQDGGEPYAARLGLGPDHRLHLEIEPAAPGENEVHLHIRDEDGEPADIAEEVELRFELPEAGIAPISRTPEPVEPARYHHVGTEMAQAGTWEIEVRVLLGEFELHTAATEVPLGDPDR